MPNIEIRDADLSNPDDARDVVDLLNAYALDPAGGGHALDPHVKERLAAELAKRAAVHVALAFADQAPAGLAICIEGFSSFACMPLLNLHDLVVVDKFRGLGIAKKLLAHVETIGRRLGCCKITLEVLEGNAVAQSLYRSQGFAGYELDPEMGKAMLWQRKLL